MISKSYEMLHVKLLFGDRSEQSEALLATVEWLYKTRRARAGSFLLALLAALAWGLAVSDSVPLVLATPLVFFGVMIVMQLLFVRKASDEYHRSRQLAAASRINRVLRLNEELHELQALKSIGG